MTLDVESQLRRQLRAAADALPQQAGSANTVMRIGRRRRRRSLAASSVAGLVVLTGLVLGASRMLPLFGHEGEVVIADAPEVADELGFPDDPGVPNETPTTSIPDVAEPSLSQQPGPISTAAVIDGLTPEAVLFYTDHEGCATLDDERAHPDWIQGQAPTGDSVQAGGVATYGYAFNQGRPAPAEGPATDGDIDWRFIETDLALSGRCALSMSLNRADVGAGGVGLFRRYDDLGRPLPSDAYYSVWLYLPDEITFDNQGIVDGTQAFGFWKLFEIKNNVRRPDGGNESLSALSFQAGKTPDEPFMSLSVFRKAACGATESCPQADTITQENPLPIPTGQWVHFEAHLVAQADAGGRLQVWQDGQRIIDFRGQTERPDTERRTWSLTHAGRLHHTRAHTIFADDPAITTAPLHPLLFGN